MTDYLRLRQICLVARDLERVVDDIRDVLGLEVCYRDPNVGKFGLINALFPIGRSFLEVVVPTREGTTAGRFLDRHQDRFGYMAILDCNDVDRRQKHVQTLGVRLANLYGHDNYSGAQLHPKDTGATMIELNETRHDGHPVIDLDGPYHPAGPDWHPAVRNDVTTDMLAARIEGRDAAALADRWSSVLERGLSRDKQGNPTLELDKGAIRFVTTGEAESVLAAIEIAVVDADRIKARATARGCVDKQGNVVLCGTRFDLVS